APCVRRASVGRGPVPRMQAHPAPGSLHLAGGIARIRQARARGGQEGRGRGHAPGSFNNMSGIGRGAPVCSRSTARKWLPTTWSARSHPSSSGTRAGNGRTVDLSTPGADVRPGTAGDGQAGVRVTVAGYLGVFCEGKYTVILPL